MLAPFFFTSWALLLQNDVRRISDDRRMWELMQKGVRHAQGVRSQGRRVSGCQQQLAVAQKPVTRALSSSLFLWIPVPVDCIVLHNVDILWLQCVNLWAAPAFFCFQASLSDALGPWGLRGSEPIPGPHGTPCEPARAAAAAVRAGVAARRRGRQEGPGVAARVALSQDRAPGRPALRSAFAETHTTEWAFWSNSLTFLFPPIIISTLQLCVIISVLSCDVRSTFLLPIATSDVNQSISSINIFHLSHNCCAAWACGPSAVSPGVVFCRNEPADEPNRSDVRRDLMNMFVCLFVCKVSWRRQLTSGSKASSAEHWLKQCSRCFWCYSFSCTANIFSVPPC